MRKHWQECMILETESATRPFRLQSVMEDSDSAPVWSLLVFKGKPHNHSPLCLIELFHSSAHILCNVLSLTLFTSAEI